jgi:hypothetical protein
MSGSLNNVWSATSSHAPSRALARGSIVYGVTLLMVASNLVNIYIATLADLHTSSCISSHRPWQQKISSSVMPVPANRLSCSMLPMGGGRSHLFPYLSVAPFIKKDDSHISADHVFKYVDHVDEIGCLNYPVKQGFAYVDLVLGDIVPLISKQVIQKIARIHNITLGSCWHLPKDQLVKAFEGHDCVNCNLYTFVFEPVLSSDCRKKMASAKRYVNLTKEQKK